nr:MAG TPA: hypothetical protein [Caudoviricetes sp.]
MTRGYGENRIPFISIKSKNGVQLREVCSLSYQ